MAKQEALEAKTADIFEAMPISVKQYQPYVSKRAKDYEWIWERDLFFILIPRHLADFLRLEASNRVLKIAILDEQDRMPVSLDSQSLLSDRMANGNGSPTIPGDSNAPGRQQRRSGHASKHDNAGGTGDRQLKKNISRKLDGAEPTITLSTTAPSSFKANKELERVRRAIARAGVITPERVKATDIVNSRDGEHPQGSTGSRSLKKYQPTQAEVKATTDIVKANRVITPAVNPSTKAKKKE